MTTTSEIISRYGKYITCMTLISFGASSCASTQDGQLAQAQGTGLGALGGALIGGAVGGRDGALIGAGVGAASGFAYGTHIANKKAAYKSTEDWLDACIKDAEQKRSQAAAYNRSLNNKLASLQNKVRVAKAAGNKSELSSLKREIMAERKMTEKEASRFSKESQIQRGVIKEAGGAAPSRLKSLRQSTNGIDTQVSIMNKNAERYAALESQTDV
jgi:outer membrane lipoprotein SlyB